MTTQRIKELVEDYFNVDLSEKTRKRELTVLYGLRQYKNLYEFDKPFRRRVNPFLNEIEEEINKSSVNSRRTIHRQIRRLKERILQMEKQLEDIE